MPKPSIPERISHDEVIRFFSEKVDRFGPQPRGVDWPEPEQQRTRFRELTRLLPSDRSFSVLDYGCGYGALRSYLAEHGWAADYWGFDISPAMIDAARSVYPDEPVRFSTYTPPGRLFDYAFASGIFNAKMSASDNQWEEEILRVLDEMNNLTRRGFGYNFLSIHRETHRKLPHLYYGDPARFLTLSLQRYSIDVAVAHDYGLWDFTVLVRK